MTQTRSATAVPSSDSIPPHVWRIAGVVVFGALMSMLDTSLVNIGLHTIGADLHATLATVQWVASGYLLALAVSLPMCGWLARRFGPARVWVCAIAAFTVASGLCALAPGIGWLITLRVLQGLAAGVVVPAGQTILGQAAGPKYLGRVMAVVGIAVVSAPALGPTVGGLMLQNLSWQWLFLINLPFGVVACALGLRVLPRATGTHSGGLDFASLILAGGGASAVVYGLGELGVHAANPLTVWLPIAAGLVALAGFVIRSARRELPLLDVRMFRDPVFAAANTASFFAGAAMFGLMVLLPLYFQVLHHDGLIRTGLLLLAYGGGGIVALPLGGRLTDRVGGGIVAVCGTLVVAATVAPLALLPADANAVLLQVLLFMAGVGTALSSMPLVSTAYAAVRHDQMPDAAAFVNILQRIGGAIGVAVVAVILSRAVDSAHPVAFGYHVAFGGICALSLVAALASGVLLRVRR
ncbi:MDR family MFS transporter [Nocardia sp. alder85J]|uniref:MDR family MFS transporter n=1 Tax=Nocardia sp. alder85J TaxID=2862949 RepID=UPI001CD21A29|nr:MDR family MFS transporter [Nocardia sp. alder85J]MCX4093462.1 MDR family MFS transporter [Nocardia sp. alder85J]